MTHRLTSVGSANHQRNLDLVDSYGNFYVSYSDQNGGPYGRYFTLDQPGQTTASHESWSLLGIANRPDGTVVRRRINTNSPGYEIYDPATATATPFDLGRDTSVIGVDSRGYLVVTNWVTGEYAIVNPDCG